MEKLKFEFDVNVEELGRPLLALDKKYEEGLVKLRAEAERRGELERVLAIKHEIENYKTGTAISPDRKLAGLQNIYRRETGRLRLEKRRREGALLRSHAAELDTLKTKLTKEGKIDEATQTKRVREALAPRAARLNSTGEIIDLSRLGATNVERVDFGGRLRLKSLNKPQQFAMTPDEYAAPLRIRLLAKTDSTNIRIKFGRGLVILNWEANLDELRIHDPKSGRHLGFKGRGRVAVDQWHEIVWEIDEKQTRLFVNGSMTQAVKGDYRSLRAPIGVGPAHGSVIEIGDMVVEKL